ncbi:MAG: CRISPR-associated protein [Rivularia sp. (in: Bacteria)]|nr:CRISPR-associated protein [Rivularia sp. MS3]
MHRLVISTVGTSLLTNEINERKDPKNWLTDLTKTANWTEEQIANDEDYSHVSSKIITSLKTRVEKKLNNGNILQVRELSAELNGIYGLYDENLEQGISDTHILISTDTAQAIITSKLIEKFLQDNNLKYTTTFIQPQLSLKSSTVFKEGMAQVIPKIRDIIADFPKNQYQICFNLVGGFKALQGYFNTIGMFYANEIIYVFEGSNEVIKIPKLPVKVDIEKIEPFKVQLAMMEQGDVYKSWEELKNIPDDWVLVDGQEMTLSTWGQLIWSKCKEELLSQDKLLKFPKIEYKSTFKDDYTPKSADEKIILQENLARAACLLLNNKDGITAMKQDGIFQLRRYTGKNKDIDHFNLPKARRVSCIADGNNLQLRHYGEHDYVNKNP